MMLTDRAHNGCALIEGLERMADGEICFSYLFVGTRANGANGVQMGVWFVLSLYCTLCVDSLMNRSYIWLIIA